MIGVVRLSFIAMLAFCGFYGLLHLAFVTPFFKDKARIKRLARRTLFLIVSVFMTAMLACFFVAVGGIH